MNQKLKKNKKKKQEFKKDLVSYDVAREEFMTYLLETRRIKERLLHDKTGDAEQAIESCIQNIMDGTFKINENGSITHKLVWPIGEELSSPITELTYSLRFPSNDLDGYRKFSNPTVETKTKVVMAALSQKPYMYIKKVETPDLMTFTELSFFYFLG